MGPVRRSLDFQMQKKFDRRRKRNKKTFEIRSCQVFSTATKNTVISVPKSISWSWSKWSVFSFRLNINVLNIHSSFLFLYISYHPLALFSWLPLVRLCPVFSRVWLRTLSLRERRRELLPKIRWRSVISFTSSRTAELAMTITSDQ